MKKLLPSFKSNVETIGFAFFFGLAIFLVVVGYSILNPQNIAWLQAGDPAQHYLGWEFFRRAPWSFPVGLSPNFGMSVSSSIVYTDSIPLIAIPLKLFTGYLSENFQYLGIWILICFCLQAFFALKIAQLMTSRKLVQLLMMTLLVFSPTMIGRYTFETSLSSHFLFLAALYLALIGPRTKTDIAWIFLLVSAALIHFYLFAGVAIFWFANFLDQCRRDHFIRGVHARWKLALLTISIVIFCAWQAGYFAISLGSSSPGGYGANPINLFTLIDAKGWSYILKGWGQYDYHSSDDLNFLGSGMLLLLPFSIVGLFEVRKSVKFFISQHLFALICIVGLTIFSISNQIHLGNHLWQFAAPEWYLRLAGVLRASARMFWLVYYAIALLIIFGALKFSHKKWYIIILTVAVTLQIVDTSAGWKKRKSALYSATSSTSETSFSGHFWQEAGPKYQAIIKILTEDNISVNWEAIARFALQYNLATNSVYLSRTDVKSIHLLNNSLEEMLLSGNYNPAHLYFIDPNKAISALAHVKDSDLLAEIDGAVVLAPQWLNCKECFRPPKESLLATLIPNPQIGKVFEFNRASQYGKSRFILNSGWNYPESWGIWSDGNQAQLTLPLAKNANSLTLTLRALVNSLHPSQRVEITANQEFNKTYFLTKDSQNLLVIPISEKMQQDGYLQLWINLYDYARPSEIGLGTDSRQLAIGLISGEYK